MEEIFGDNESAGSFSSDSEEEKFDLRDFSVYVPLKFNSENDYIDKMIELMKLNNRDPLGIKLFKVKIEDNQCTLQDKKDRKKEEEFKNNKKGGRRRRPKPELENVDLFKCTILS